MGVPIGSPSYFAALVFLKVYASLGGAGEGGSIPFPLYFLRNMQMSSASPRFSRGIRLPRGAGEGGSIPFHSYFLRTVQISSASPRFPRGIRLPWGGGRAFPSYFSRITQISSASPRYLRGIRLPWGARGWFHTLPFVFLKETQISSASFLKEYASLGGREEVFP